jgi:hypothetical protein
MKSLTKQNSSWVTFAALAICGITFFSFLGLTPLGVWHDEFITLGHVREDGFTIIKERILHWSPRPLSEMIIWWYGRAVMHFNRPLITSALLPCWGFLVAFTLAPSAVSRKGFVASSVLLTLFLLGHKVDEVFFWPVASVAYMPTLAALAALLTIDFAGLSDTTFGRAFALVALLIAATSTEIGALFSAGYCLLAFIVSAISKDRLKFWWALPFAVSIGVLYLMFTGRVAQNIEMFGDRSIIHHPMLAVRAAGGSFFQEFFGTDVSQAPTLTSASAFLSKATFLLGTYFLFSLDREETRSRRQLMRLVLGVSLIGAAFLMLAAAYYQFGISCCERHATMRQCYILIALGAFGLFAARLRPVRSPIAGTLLLIVSILLPLRAAIPDLISDYRNYHAVIDARIAMWESGLTPGKTMVIQALPPAKIAGGFTFPIGTFAEGDKDEPPIAPWIMYYFKKTSITFLAPHK